MISNDNKSGRTIFESPIKVNWAYQSTSSAIAREETSSHFTIFVGDLATEVNDHALKQAFSEFRSMSDARVMWDMTTGRSRGYGFVSFVQRIDAEKAIIEMSGTWLGSRTIRCNWANQKQISPTSPSTNIAAAPFDIAQQYAIVANQAPFHLTTIYVGNLAADTTEDDLSPLFSTYGDTCEIKMWSDRGFGFVNVGVHDLAALAIVQLQGVIVKGRPIKCSCMFFSFSFSIRLIRIGQFKSESSGRQRARSVAASNSQVSDEYMTYGGYPATQAHNNLSNMIPRQISAPAQVMSPEQLLAIQVHQQQQALARISLQVASMTAQSNYQ